MARKKQSVEAYGRSWSPIDLPNLEKAIQLYERLNYLQDHFAGSLSSSNAIMQQINETSDIKNELAKLNIKLNEEQLKQVTKLLNNQQEVNKQLDETNDKQKQQTGKSTTQQVIERSNIGTSNNFNKITRDNFSSTVISRVQQNYTEKALKQNLEKFQENAKKMGRDPNSELVSKLAQNKTVNDLKSVSGKFNVAGDLLNVAAKTFGKAVDVFKNLFKGGLERQKEAYENTFENISVRTSLTRGEYYSQQANTNNELNELGLGNNIATSDVQNMWNTLSNNGMSQEQIFANAIDTVLTNKIVPYLDTNSQQTQLINERLGGDFYKQIRGISKANLDIAGNNYATQEILTQLLTEVEPMSDEAIANLAQGSEEVTSMINYLMSKEGGNLSKTQATAFATQLYKQQQYSDQILSSGTTYEKMALLNNQISGINIYDPTQFNQAIGTNISTAQTVAGWTPGYSNTTSGMITNVVGSSMGIDYNTMNAALKVTQAGQTGKDIANKTDLDTETINKLAEQATQDYKSDKNQTNSTLQEITVENLANELAVGEEWMGHWTGIITTAIKGLGTVLTTYLGAKFLTSLVGGEMGSSIKGLFTSVAGTGGGSGIAGALTTAGAIGGAVVAGVTLSNAILSKVTEISDKEKGQIQNAASEAGNANKGKSFNNASVQTAIEDANRMGDTGGIGNKIANGYKRAGLFGTGALFGWGSNNYSAKEKNAWNTKDYKTYDIYKPLSAGIDDMGGADSQTRLGLQIAYGLALDEIGMLEGTGILKEIFGSPIDNKNDLYQLMASAYKNNGVGKSLVNNLASVLVDEGIQPFNYEGKEWDGTLDDILNTYIDKTNNESDSEIKEAMLGFASHRQGLPNVPYDNYPAVLHEGEAVLTADTSNELRNLIDTYRETNLQSIDFDTIIQTQTVALIEKMDQIIQRMGGTGTNTTNSEDKVWNSMLHLRSTKTLGF